MPRFLDTIGNSDIAIAICDRCRMKRAHSVMRNDPNFPGLRVCDQGCADQFDPYRLPARKTERITIRFPRPDADVAATQDAIVNSSTGQYLISTEGNSSTPEQNGNLDNLSP
jgi:hypothetical protein